MSGASRLLRSALANALRQGALGTGAGATIGALTGLGTAEEGASVDEMGERALRYAGIGAAIGAGSGSALGAAAAPAGALARRLLGGSELGGDLLRAAGHFPTGMAGGKIAGGLGGAAYGGLDADPDASGADRLRHAALLGALGFSGGGIVGGAGASGASALRAILRALTRRAESAAPNVGREYGPFRTPYGEPDSRVMLHDRFAVQGIEPQTEADWEEIVRQGGRRARVSLDDLIATQDSVHPGFRDAPQHNTDLPQVVRERGRNYIFEGHHRLAARQDAGDRDAEVMFYESYYGQPLRAAMRALAPAAPIGAAALLAGDRPR